jgi:uncharacterized protein (TIGR03083 family)
VARPYAVSLARARAVLLEAMDAFVATASALDDRELMATSRCEGWRVADVVAHVHLGLQEMLLGLVSPTDDPPDTDAASYWLATPPPTDSGTDPIDAIRFVQRLAAAYTRPSGAVAHLRLTTDGLRRAITATDVDAVAFQGHVLSTGDFLATWAVELAVHQLDLGQELDLPGPPASALALTRATLEALLDATLPTTWSDVDAVLVGTGRVPLDAAQRVAAGDLADRMPVLG